MVEPVHVLRAALAAASSSSGSAVAPVDPSRRKSYKTDLSDAQWEILRDLVPPAKSGGRPRVVDMREIVNTALYINHTGCQWDMLPHDLQAKSTVFGYYDRWLKDGTLDRMVTALREPIRVRDGREPTPSAACIDTQSVKTTETGGGARGYDGGKKIKGRKRHLLTDTMGLLIAVVVTGANADDGTSAPELLAKVSADTLPRLKAIYGDNKYRNNSLDRWMKDNRPGWTIIVSCRPEGSQGFVPLKIRWVVERTNAWNGRCRRHSKDYERRPESSAAMIKLSAIKLMLNRLAPKPDKPKFNYRKTTVNA